MYVQQAPVPVQASFVSPDIVASITKKQAEDIAKQKMNDLNAIDLEQAVKIIAGSARSMGIEVKE